MRIALVDCLGRGGGKRYATIDVIGVGPRTIAGILEKYNVDYKLFVGEEVVYNPKVLRGFDVLLISAMVSDSGCVGRVLRRWRKYSRGYVILGGPLTLDRQLLKNLEFNVAIVGEGEVVFEKILKLILEDNLDFSKLKGVKGTVYRFRKKVIFNGLAENLTGELLNKYKASTKILSQYPFYWAARVYVEVVRGCSNFRRTSIKLPDGKECIKCNVCYSGDLEERLNCPVNIPPGCGYCGVPSYFGPARSKSIDVIVDEVKCLIDEGATRIVLSAPDFLDFGRDLLVKPKPLTDPREPPANIEHIEALLSQLSDIRDVAKGYVTIMIENIKPNLVTEEVAKVLGKYLKGTTVHLGIESGDEYHARMLGRPNTVEEGVNAVKLLRKYGLRPYVYFIHGLPGQTERTVINTLRIMDLVYRYGAEKLTVYRFRPLPYSAFQDFKEPPPAVKDKLSARIYRKARDLNMLVKRRMLKKRFKVVSVARYPPDRRFLVTYPLTHGPVILVPSKRKFRGKILEVIAKDIYRERVVRGKVNKIIREVKGYRYGDEFRVNPI